MKHQFSESSGWDKELIHVALASGSLPRARGLSSIEIPISLAYAVPMPFWRFRDQHYLVWTGDQSRGKEISNLCKHWNWKARMMS